MQVLNSKNDFLNYLSSLSKKNDDSLIFESFEEIIFVISDLYIEAKMRFAIWQSNNSSFEDIDLIFNYINEIVEITPIVDCRPVLLKSFFEDKYNGEININTYKKLLEYFKKDEKYIYFEFLPFWISKYFFLINDQINFLHYINLSINMNPNNLSNYELLGDYYMLNLEYENALSAFTNAARCVEKISNIKKEIDNSSFESIVNEYFIGNNPNKFVFDNLENKIENAINKVKF